MSIILATDSYETIRPVVRRLVRQTVRDQLEIVLISPPEGSIQPDHPELQGFAGVRVLSVESLYPLAAARTAGVRAATAPLVFIGETHTYPHPDWAAALLEAHRPPWVAIAPGFDNANPRGALSWAIFLLDYGAWLHALPSGEVAVVPTHNVALERAVLLELGTDLEKALGHGDQLAIRFRAAGHRSYFEAAAKIEHLNVNRLAPWMGERFLGGLLVGGRRAERWSALRRLLYFCGSPLIPVVLLLRVHRAVRALRASERLPTGTVPALVVGALVSAVGEMLGYARGAGPVAKRQMMEYEVHKVRYAAPR